VANKAKAPVDGRLIGKSGCRPCLEAQRCALETRSNGAAWAIPLGEICGY